MGQVPSLTKSAASLPHKYLLIGSGRLARHLQFYFKALNLDLIFWSRDNQPQFNSLSFIESPQDRLIKNLEACTHVLLAISDRSLDEFYKEAKNFENKKWIHFSGVYSHPGMTACHPLMSFGSELYELNIYQSFPFVLDKGSPALKELFPKIPNPSFQIDPDKRTLYHAYCVMSGNFTHLLWWMVEEAFIKELGLPAAALVSYKAKIFEGALVNPAAALTGPLVRNDQSTLDRHLSVLDVNKADLYKQFIQIFKDLKTEDESRKKSERGGLNEHP